MDIFEKKKFRYMEISEYDLLVKLNEEEAHPVLLSFNASDSFRRGSYAVFYPENIEQAHRMIRNIINSCEDVNILVFDCFVMQSSAGTKMKKGSSLKYLKASLSRSLKEKNCAVTFATETREPICKRHFSEK